jgi:lipopolysaccharide export system protein LptA
MGGADSDVWVINCKLQIERGIHNAGAGDGPAHSEFRIEHSAFRTPLMKRLYRSAVSLVIVLTAYWTYSLAAVRWIEPPAPEEGGNSPSNRNFAGENDYRIRQLAKLFPADAWELQDPTLIEIDRGKLLMKGYRNLGGGLVEIKPLTMVILPEGSAENEAQHYRQAVILKTETAELKFDRELDLGNMGGIRLLGGQFPKAVTIYSAGKDPGPDDDLRIDTCKVELVENEVRTDEPVNFRWGKSFGMGRRMRIKLRPGSLSSGNELAASNTSGIERFELERIERLHIDVPAAPPPGRAAGQPSNARPGLPLPGGRPLEILCRGPFSFQQSDWSASFRDRVEVRQINPRGPADQLFADVLTLYFGPRRQGIDPAKASPKDMEPVRVAAWGQPVQVYAPSQKVTAQADHLDYYLRENRVVLESSLEVVLKQNQQELHARRIDYQAIEGPLLGKALAEGPGWLRGSKDQVGGDFFTAKWKGQLELAPQGDRQLITIRGDGDLVYSKRGELKAQEIKFWLARVPQTGRSPATWRPDRMEARKDIYIQSPQLSGVVEELAVDFTAPPPPSVYRGTVGPLGRNERQVDFSPSPQGVALGWENPAPLGQSNNRLGWENPALLGQSNNPSSKSGIIHTVYYTAAPEPSVQKPQQHFHVTGRSLTARVQMTDRQQGELAELTIEGNVCCQETQTLRPDEKPLRITGQRVHVTDASGAQTTVRVTGQPAHCEGRGWNVDSGNINLSYGENRVWIEGPGQMVLPNDAALGGPMAPPGQTPDAVGPVKIEWQQSMQFDGRTAKFVRGATVSTISQRLQTDTLEAVLDRRIGFKDPNLQNQPQPRPDRLFCRGGTWLENRSADPAGQLSSLDRMYVTDLDMNIQTGDLAAAGSGWINSVRRGGDLPLQTSPAGRTPPPASAHADPNQLYCLHVDYQGSLSGNLSKRQRHLVFDRVIGGAYAPVNSWEATLVPDSPEGLGPKGLSLECDRLSVDQWPSPRGSPEAVELTAAGNAIVQDNFVTARAVRITYAKIKNLLIVEGDGRTDAELYFQKQIGAQPAHVAARQIWYWMDTGQFRIIDGRSVGTNAPASGGAGKGRGGGR